MASKTIGGIQKYTTKDSIFRERLKTISDYLTLPNCNSAYLFSSDIFGKLFWNQLYSVTQVRIGSMEEARKHHDEARKVVDAPVSFTKRSPNGVTTVIPTNSLFQRDKCASTRSEKKCDNAAVHLQCQTDTMLGLLRAFEVSSYFLSVPTSNDDLDSTNGLTQVPS